MNIGEKGPARVPPQGGAGAVVYHPIVVQPIDLRQRCRCAVIEAEPLDEHFLVAEGATYHNTGSGWRRIADFMACLHRSSFDNPDRVLLVVQRHDERQGIELSRAEFASPGWVTMFLGEDAAASVVDYAALRTAIVLFGFAVSNCRGCSHDA